MDTENKGGLITDFLKIHRIQNEQAAIFALTPSSLAISVYRQQIRALNLAYCIKNNWKEIKPDSNSDGTPARIAVIGGGFAGITVATGLLRLGFETHLFEQRTQLCHLQAGCETQTPGVSHRRRRLPRISFLQEPARPPQTRDRLT